MISENYELFQKRLLTSSKVSKDDLILDKQKSFQKALESSYNSELVNIYNPNFSIHGDIVFSALIDPIDTEPKIERKSFSTLLSNNCEVGTVIFWRRRGDYWMITEESETESAIFQGFISQALYKIEWKDLNTGKIYDQYACAKGPEETVISDGIKHGIIFDSFSDSLYLMVPKMTEGIELLKKYTELMINNRKWIIEIIDDITYDKLVTLQLKEIAINQDLDSSNLVNEDINIAFRVDCALKGISELNQNSVVNLDPILYKNNNIISYPFVIKTNNCIANEDNITFNSLGRAVVEIWYDSIDHLEFVYIINILENGASNESITEIWGNSSIKTLNTVTYYFKNLHDGVHIPVQGTWSLDLEYVSIVSSDINSITLKANNKIGTFTLKYNNGTQEYSKVISIIPMFGGN